LFPCTLLLLPTLSPLFPYTTLFRSSWKALNLRKTLLMASSVRLKPLNCSRLPCVYAQETLTFLLTQKKTCVKNYVSVSCAYTQGKREIGRAVQQECRDRSRMPSSA